MRHKSSLYYLTGKVRIDGVDEVMSHQHARDLLLSGAYIHARVLLSDGAEIEGSFVHGLAESGLKRLVVTVWTYLGELRLEMLGATVVTESEAIVPDDGPWVVNMDSVTKIVVEGIQHGDVLFAPSWKLDGFPVVDLDAPSFWSFMEAQGFIRLARGKSPFSGMSAYYVEGAGLGGIRLVEGGSEDTFLSLPRIAGDATFPVQTFDVPVNKNFSVTFACAELGIPTPDAG